MQMKLPQTISMLDATFACSIFLLIGMGIAIDDKTLNISDFVGGLSGIGTMILSFVALKAMNDWKRTHKANSRKEFIDKCIEVLKRKFELEHTEAIQRFHMMNSQNPLEIDLSPTLNDRYEVQMLMGMLVNTASDFWPELETEKLDYCFPLYPKNFNLELASLKKWYVESAHYFNTVKYNQIINSHY